MAGAVSAVGVFGRGSGATADAVSIRGERYEYVTDGVYAYNAERVVAEGVGWDAVTLFAAVPALLLCAPQVARGSLRGRLVAAGVLAYLGYQYLMYAVFWALGPLFPFFVALYPASLATLVWTVSTLDVRSLPARFDGGFPRRSVAVFSAAMALLLVAMWSKRIALGLAGDVAGAGLLGTPTLTVQALDLGIVVPLAIATAVLIWRRHPVGHLLAAVFSVKGVTMAGAIVAMLVSAWLVEGRPDVAALGVFGVATGAAGLIAYRVIASAKGGLSTQQAADLMR